VVYYNALKLQYFSRILIEATIMMPASSEILAAVFRRCEMWTMITRTIPVAIIIIIIMLEVANSSSSRKSRTGSSFIVA